MTVIIDSIFLFKISVNYKNLKKKKHRTINVSLSRFTQNLKVITNVKIKMNFLTRCGGFRSNHKNRCVKVLNVKVTIINTFETRF